MKLYELTAAYNNILEMADVMDEQTFTDTLAAIEEAIEDKAENYAKLIRSLEVQAAAIEQEEKRLAERRKSLTNKVATLKTTLKEQMELLGTAKIKSPLFTVWIQNNPASVEVTDETQLTAFHVPQPPKLDKKAIADALKQGIEINGARLIQTTGLRIK